LGYATEGEEMNEKWSKEQIDSYRANHSILSDLSDEEIIEHLEFEEECGPLKEIHYKGKIWKEGDK
jgi:hypothetical protein